MQGYKYPYTYIMNTKHSKCKVKIKKYLKKLKKVGARINLHLYYIPLLN